MEIVKDKIISFVEKLDKFSFNSLKEYANLFELSLKVPYSIKIIYIIFEYTCAGLFTIEHIVHADKDERYYIQKTLIDYLFADKKKININQLIYSEDNWTEDTNSNVAWFDSERTNVSDMNSNVAWMGSERTNVSEESNYASDNNSNVACVGSIMYMRQSRASGLDSEDVSRISSMDESDIGFSNNMEQTEVFQKDSIGLHLQSPKSDLSMDDDIIFPYLCSQICQPPNSPNVTDWESNSFLNINFQESGVDDNKSISDYYIPSLDSISDEDIESIDSIS